MISFHRDKLGLVLLALLPFVLYLGRLIIFDLYGLSYLVSNTIFIGSFVDTILTCLVFLIYFIRYDIKGLQSRWKYKFSGCYKDKFLLITQLFFLAVTLSYSGSFIPLIVSGLSRQELVDTVGQTPLILSLAAKLFVTTIVLISISSASRLVKIISVVGFALVTVIFTSRANILTVLIFFLIVTLVDFNKNRLIKFFVFSILMVGLAILVTVFVQNRVLESNFMGPLKPLEDYFLYGGYSFYLAEFAINYAYEHDKYLFPFFGYVSEFLGREFLIVSPSSAIDSDFVLRFKIFYSDYRQHFANVIYPWWAWFYGAFGYLGLLFKALFIYLLLIFSFRVKSYPLVFILIYWGMFTTPLSFPIISLDGFFTLFFVIFVDCLARVKVSKGLKLYER